MIPSNLNFVMKSREEGVMGRVGGGRGKREGKKEVAVQVNFSIPKISQKNDGPLF